MTSTTTIKRLLCASLLTVLAIGRAEVANYDQSLRISEFMAVNNSGLQDADGEFSDWIEIHNPTPATINLGGWYLTDTITNKTRWRFPATNLNAGAYLVVFASDKNRTNAGAQLHTNFKLSGPGEYLGLVMPDGVTVASEYAPLFPPQVENISYGLTPVAGNSTTLVTSNGQARILVPTALVAGDWRTAGFEPDGSWPVASAPLGYETAPIVVGASNVLFVVATASLSAGDLAISNRLANVLGCIVTVVGDTASQASQATGKQLVLVSSSVASGNVTNKFRDVAVPVINCDRSLVDDFRIGVTPGSTTTSSNVVITAAGNGHPAVGGLSLGTNAIRNTTTAMSVADTNGLAPGAQVLATANGWPMAMLVESGQLLLSGQVAPARRMHMSWGDAGLMGVNASGLALFDATIRYCLATNSSAGALVFAPLIATDVRSVMQHTNSSLLTRMTFAPPEFFTPNSLSLKVRYDDGFVAWLNGVEIARRNAADPVAWNSGATTSRANSAVLVPETLDVSAHAGLLNASLNVLAVQGLNASAADGDFFLEAGLTASSGISGAPAFYTTPTPGSANVAGTLGIVPAVTFSHDRGYYPNAFVLTLSNALAGAEIRYTTNGTPPTASSGLVYTAPFTIRNTMVIRAAAYRPGYFTSTNAATMSYLFLEQVLRQPSSLPGWPQPMLAIGSSVNGSSTRLHDYGMDPNVVDAPGYSSDIRAAMTAIPTMSLTVKQSDMWDANGIGGFYRSTTGQEAPVSVELIYPDQPTNNVQADASVEGHSHDRLKRTLRLTFRASTGASRFESRLFKDAPLFGDTAEKKANSIVLRGGNNRCWARGWNPAKTTYTEDEFYRSTQIALSGVGPHGSFVHLYINGIYWGLYNPVERPDNAFAAAYLGGDDDEWFSINHGGVTNGLRTRWDYLTGSLAAKDMSQAANYAELREYLAVDHFIDYLLTSWYIGLGDWPGNNWWAASRNTPPGPAYFFAWDGEWSFGTSMASSLRASVHSAFRTSSTLTIPKLWHSARVNADFMMLVADRAFKHTRTNGALSDAKATERWLTLSNALHIPVIPESARWGDSIDPNIVRSRDTDWNNEQVIIGNLLPGNGETLLSSMRSYGFYPNVAPPEFNHPGGLVSLPFSFALTHANGSGDIYFTVDGSDPRLPGGAINPAATLYTGAIPLSQSARVQARVLDGATWSALNDAAFALPGTTTLQPTELMYHASDPTPAEVSLGFTNDTFFEFVELKNTGSNPLALAGVRLTDGVNFDFPATNLTPGQILLLIRHQAGFESRYGTNLPVWGVYAGGLDNDGDTLRLRDAANAIVFNFRFEDYWQTNTDGGGHSLVPTALSWPMPDPATNTTWRASTNPGGSPGLDDPAALTGFLAWKEIYFSLTERDNPAISGPNANPDGDRWSNFTEYAFVTDPRGSGGEVLPTARVEGGLLKVVFRRLKSPSDVAYRLEIATELNGGWRDAGSEAVIQQLGSDQNSETVEAVFPAGISTNTALYLRVVAVPVP